MPDGRVDEKWDRQLLLAIERALDRQEFELHYQPKYDLFRHRITGVEALARWNRPGRGLMPPSIFIPAAEESGLIVPLGKWALGEACRQAAIWRAEGRQLSVAVNVSTQQLMAGTEFELDVGRALAVNNLPPALLELEVTESVLMEANARYALDRLAATGVGIAIDDFGTGYSSLAYLKRIPATVLKIDKSFVDGLAASLVDCMLVDGMIRIAHGLGKKVVAEGVETDEQRDVLEMLGCDVLQGYSVSRPLAPGPLSALL